MTAIFKKELKLYFSDMLGYVFIAYGLIILGFFSSIYNLFGLFANYDYSLSGASFIVLMGIPLLTMRMMSEERRQKTDQLLYSAPVGTYGIVFGKFLAALVVFAVPLLIAGIYPLILSLFGNVAFLTAYNALLGLLFLGGALISVGFFLSALTESQLVAAVTAFGAILLLNFMRNFPKMISTSAVSSTIAFAIVALLLALLVYAVTRSRYIALGVGVFCLAALAILYGLDKTLLAGTFNTVVGTMAVFAPFDNFIAGIFDTTGLLYFISVTALFLFFTAQTIEKRRWS
jgi:ABC-2 type transport system permease protein